MFQELTIYYKNKQSLRAEKFYFVKLIISKTECKDYFYLDRGYKIQIWFESLKNKSYLKKYLKRQRIKHTWKEYNRNHIIELFQPACKSIIENLGFCISDYYSLGYFIHTILTSLFLGWEEQMNFFKYMVDVADRNVKYYSNLKMRKQDASQSKKG